MSKTRANFLALVLVVIVSTALFYFLDLTIQTAKRGHLEERFHSLVLEVDTRCEETDFFVERDNDWVEEFEWYSSTLAHYMAVMDGRQNTFAAVYTDEMQFISSRHETFTGQPFDPLAFPEIVDALRAEKTGEQDVVFTISINGEPVRRPFRIYFRRVPLVNEDNYLIAVAGFAFTEDNVRLQPYLYTLLYLVFGLASVSFGVIIFTGTHFIFVYQKDHKDFRKIWGLE